MDTRNSCTKPSNRMFPYLPQWVPPGSLSKDHFFDEKKFALCDFMKHEGDEKSKIPAGYTYLGQFIAHDMSFISRVSSTHGSLVSSVRNLRTATLDLDSVYGGGPKASPIYYDQGNRLKIKFLVDCRTVEDRKGEKVCFNDLPRKSYESPLKNCSKKKESIDIAPALIPDPRNDENLIISQLHLAFLLFHNKVVEKVRSDSSIKTELSSLFESKKEKIGFLESLNKATSVDSIINNSDDFYEKALNIMFKRLINSLDEKNKNFKFDHLIKTNSDINTMMSIGDINIDINTIEGELAIQDITDWPKGLNSQLLELIAIFKSDYFELIQLRNDSQKIILDQFDKEFKTAQREVIWHYQWIVIYDYLHKIVGEDIVEKVMQGELSKTGKQLFPWQEQVSLPLEFAVAVFRMGHSMVRNSYDFNETVYEPPSTKGDIFSKRPDIISKNYIDWSLFFFSLEDDNQKSTKRNFSKKINTFIDFKMASDVPVPSGSQNIVFRNLHSGYLMKLPVGQDVAKYMGENIYTNSDFCKEANETYSTLKKTFPFGEEIFKEFCDRSPLWFYVLMEATILNKGEQLGPVGGRILAEVIIGTIKRDKNSFFNQQPDWKPNLFVEDGGQKVKGNFTMEDLLTVTGIYNGATEVKCE